MEELLLGVNIDHIATIRQARGTRYPSPVHAALEAEQAGAHAVTLHLREDRRHIQDSDVEQLRGLLLTRMNLEMALTDEMLGIARRIRPHECCLVPERREELTTEGGLDIAGQEERVAAGIEQLAEAGVRVSLFVDAELEQVEAAARTGAPVIELHTGQYAEADTAAAAQVELSRIIRAAERGSELGLQVNAGHGLSYENIKAVAAIPQLRELNIGHAIVARALFSGLKEAVREMNRLMREGRYGCSTE